MDVAKMKELLKKGLIGIGTVLGLASCGGSDGRIGSSDPFCQQVLPAVEAFMTQASEAYPTPDEPRYGGTVVLGTIGDMPDGLNSAVSSNYSDAQHQQFVGLMTLINYDAGGEPRAYLAEIGRLLLMGEPSRSTFGRTCVGTMENRPMPMT